MRFVYGLTDVKCLGLSLQIIVPIISFSELCLKFSFTVSRFQFQFEFANKKARLVSLHASCLVCYSSLGFCHSSK